MQKTLHHFTFFLFKFLQNLEDLTAWLQWSIAIELTCKRYLVTYTCFLFIHMIVWSVWCNILFEVHSLIFFPRDNLRISKVCVPYVSTFTCIERVIIYLFNRLIFDSKVLANLFNLCLRSFKRCSLLYLLEKSRSIIRWPSKCSL